jgi:hypothetical protein
MNDITLSGFKTLTGFKLKWMTGKNYLSSIFFKSYSWVTITLSCSMPSNMVILVIGFFENFRS